LIIANASPLESVHLLERLDKMVKARGNNLPPGPSQVPKKRAPKAITQLKLDACTGGAPIAHVRRARPLKVYWSIGPDVEISPHERFPKTFYPICVKATQVNNGILTVFAVNRNNSLGSGKER